MLGIDANSKLRYQRIKSRKSSKDLVSYEKFIEQEKNEFENKEPFKQNISKCLQMSDVVFNNEGSIDDLKNKILSYFNVLQLKENRPTWHDYFMNIARETAKRSTCISAMGAAVIVKNNRILSTGYIGAPRDTRDCMQKGTCLRRKLNIPSGQRYEICRSVHAEQNAIINAAREGVSIYGADIYLYMKNRKTNKISNAYPCFICKKIIINSGLRFLYGMQSDELIKKYSIENWAKEWSIQDMVNDKEQYQASYK